MYCKAMGNILNSLHVLDGTYCSCTGRAFHEDCLKAFSHFLLEYIQNMSCVRLQENERKDYKKKKAEAEAEAEKKNDDAHC